MEKIKNEIKDIELFFKCKDKIVTSSLGRTGKVVGIVYRNDFQREFDQVNFIIEHEDGSKNTLTNDTSFIYDYNPNKKYYHAIIHLKDLPC